MHRVLLLCAVLVAGCVTTTDGKVDRKTGSNIEAAQINRDLGISYLLQGNLEQAQVKLEKSLDEDPDSADTHRALGTVYFRMGDNKGAEKEFRKAVSLAPNDADAINQLAVFLCGQGKDEEALKYFNRGIEIPRFQSRYMLYTNAGTCVKQEDLSKAEEYLRLALSDNPSYPDALYQMSDVAYRRENYLQARAFVERRLSAADAAPDVLWLAYQIEVAMGDMKAAKNYSGLILERFPASVEARYVLESQRNAG